MSGRGGYDFEGIGLRTSTWKADTSLVSAVADAREWENDGRGAVVGKAVTITGDSEVGFDTSDGILLGKVLQYEFDKTVTVQDAGYTEFEGVSGSLPDPGSFVAVSAGVLVSAASGHARVVSKDETNHTIMVLIG